MKFPEEHTSKSKYNQTLSDLQSMDSETMFSNFNTLPTVNFTVDPFLIEEKLLTEKPFNRILLSEFDRCATQVDKTLTIYPLKS